MDGPNTPAPPGGGWAGHGAATAGTGAAAAEAGSVRVQFEGGRRLGGCVAWDPASGLLAVELQASGGAAAAAAVAIIDPQAPEGHFVALVPPGRGGSSGEGLAALLWSPPAARRLLLAVTSSGAAFAWTMDAPAAAAAASLIGAAANGATGSGSAQPGGGVGGVGGVACVNQWYRRAAFQLPVPQEEAPTASGGQSRGRSLLCCRFLGSASAAACWDAAAAPPFADRQLSADQVCEYYRQRGLERAFAPAVPPPPGAEPHWLRPGLLCVAAVTRQGQVLLALGGRGVSSGCGSASDGWVLAPALPLPLPPPQQSALSPDASVDVAGGSDEAQLELLLADVAPSAGGGLLVAAAAATAAPHGAAAHTSSEGPHHQLLLFEVAGPPPPLLAAGGGAEQQQQQQQQQQVARLSSPLAALPPGAAALCLAFLPGGPAAASRLLVATGCVDGGSSALVLSCSSNSRSLGGLHTWQVQPGPSLQLDRQAAVEAGAAASVAAAADGASIALLLPAERRLLRLQAGHGGAAGGDGGAALSLSQPPAAAPFAAVPAARAAEAPPGLACSPNGTFAAAAQPGASALLLLPLVAQPCGAAEVEPFMLQLGKRCCAALLAGTAGGAAGWDLTAAAAAAVRRWGHPGLQATQQLVDFAVAAVRDDARPQYAAAWSRLKAALLAAAAAAHPAAAADAGAAAVRADSAAREWMAAAADIFDAHLPDKAARAAAAKQGSAAIHADMRAALVKLMPARYWAVWAADFSCYLARCLLYWLRLNQKGKGGGGGGGDATVAPPGDGLAAGADVEAAAAAAAFAAEQSAGPDCLPCVRLLSDAQFYRSFSRLVSGIHQFHRLLSTLNRSKTPNSSFELIIQQLQLVQDMVVLLRALHEAFSKAQAEAAAAASPPGDAGEATSRLSPHAVANGGGYSGAWTLVCGQPARPLAWSGAAAALHKLRQQQGGSSLLARVRQHWSKAGAGEQSETVGSLLEAAAQLGLLPAPPAAGSGGSGGGGWQRGGPRPLLAEQLKRRAVALAAAEAGEGLLGGVALPATPPQQLRWAAAEEEDSGQDGEGSQAHARALEHPGAIRGRKRAAARQLAAWELERAAALGLPPPPPPPGSGGAALFEGRLDVLTGRPLSWEHGAAFAAADGGCATAELQPDAFAPGSALAWQAAYAAAAPVGGQRWKRLRLEEL